MKSIKEKKIFSYLKPVSKLLFSCIKSYTGQIIPLPTYLQLSRPQNIAVTRLAEIDLVTIFDCDYRWYCAIDYVIVNYIGMGSIIFPIIFNDFLAINHLLCIKDEDSPCGEPGYDCCLA